MRHAETKFAAAVASARECVNYRGCDKRAYKCTSGRPNRQCQSHPLGKTLTSSQHLTMSQQILVAVLLVALVAFVSGHGYTEEPPSRSSMWRFGFQTPVNYDDSQLWCGGYQVRYLSFSHDLHDTFGATLWDT